MAAGGLNIGPDNNGAICLAACKNGPNVPGMRNHVRDHIQHRRTPRNPRDLPGYHARAGALPATIA